MAVKFSIYMNRRVFVMEELQKRNHLGTVSRKKLLESGAGGGVGAYLVYLICITSRRNIYNHNYCYETNGSKVI